MWLRRAEASWLWRGEAWWLWLCLSLWHRRGEALRCWRGEALWLWPSEALSLWLSLWLWLFLWLYTRKPSACAAARASSRTIHPLLKPPLVHGSCLLVRYRRQVTSVQASWHEPQRCLCIRKVSTTTRLPAHACDMHMAYEHTPTTRAHAHAHTPANARGDLECSIRLWNPNTPTIVNL